MGPHSCRQKFVEVHFYFTLSENLEWELSLISFDVSQPYKKYIECFVGAQSFGDPNMVGTMVDQVVLVTVV